jgi:dolichol-phosphate mannosyltransferase
VRALVVVPTYLEAPNIGEVLTRIRPPARPDVLVVDDNSPDGTGALAEAAAAELGQIEVLTGRQGRARSGVPAGLGPRPRAGLRRPRPDGRRPLARPGDPADAPRRHRGRRRRRHRLAVRAGGSIPHWPWHRRALSRYGNAYTGAALRTGVADATSGFRAYRAAMLKAIDLADTRATGYGIQIEIAYRMSGAGAIITEIPIAFTDRTRGASKMSLKIIGEEMLLVTWWGVRDRVRRAPAA